MAVDAKDFASVQKFLHDASGVVLEAGKEYLVETRLTSVARQAGFASLQDLIAHLRHRVSDELRTQVIGALITTETQFFRDTHAFEVLKTCILPELIDKRSTERRLRLWCGAASSGQEPYSVAMVLLEHFPKLVNWDVQLIASDISDVVLERAQRGCYSHVEVNRGLPAALLQKYFQQHDTQWQLSEHIRRWVTFRQINLIHTWPSLPSMDVILLRNILIYFDLETKKAILGKVRRLLKPDGYLLLGGVETTLNLELFLPLTVGARVVLASQRTAADGEQLAQRLTTSQATMMQATPITWRLLIEAGWQGRAPFKMLCGGEALTPELAKQLTAGTATLWNLYGPTETTIWSMAAKIDSPQAPVSLGTPIDNTRLYVLDRHRQLVPAGVPGEIYIAGAGLACGYLNRPELTAERFVNVAVNGTTIERLYRTGDLARYRQDGTLAFLGRLDHQVKIRGFRIELEEIESRLQQHSGIDQAVVVAHEIVSGDTRLVAYITSHQHAELAPAALRDYLQITLPDYMIPSAFVRLDALPTTANGKIDRHALPSPHDVTQTVRAPADQQATAPQDTLERQLAQIWAEVLRVRSIGIHDDFFSSGGHSLLAVRLFARIKALCGIHLPLATLFQAPTVAQLAALLRRENWTPPWSSLVTIQPRGAKPPLYCMHAHGGHVLFYKDLAQYLDSEQPVYGLQAYGLDGVHPPHVRVEEMATHYIEEIRTLQPRGPYRLAGFCFGGLIAYEMARQLQAQGEVVSVLALLDANVTGARPRLPNADTLRYTLRRGVERVRHYLGDAWLLQAQDIWPYVSHKMRNATRKFQAPKAEFSLAVKPYTPQPYDGRIALFKASMQGAGFIDEPDLGWRALAAGGVDVQTIPGYRETMLDKPRVRLLARALQQCLDDDLLAEHGM